MKRRDEIPPSERRQIIKRRFESRDSEERREEDESGNKLDHDD